MSLPSCDNAIRYKRWKSIVKQSKPYHLEYLHCIAVRLPTRPWHSPVFRGLSPNRRPCLRFSAYKTWRSKVFGGSTSCRPSFHQACELSCCRPCYPRVILRPSWSCRTENGDNRSLADVRVLFGPRPLFTLGHAHQQKRCRLSNIFQFSVKLKLLACKLFVCRPFKTGSPVLLCEINHSAAEFPMKTYKNHSFRS